jgi:hypothetical protein
MLWPLSEKHHTLVEFQFCPIHRFKILAVLIFTLRHTHVLQCFWKGLIVLNMTVIALELNDNHRKRKSLRGYW